MTADLWQRPLRSHDERTELGKHDPDVIAGRAVHLAALDYAAAGWSVFPVHGRTDDGRCTCRRGDCGSRAKHPVTRNGLYDATGDPDQIDAWWRRWPWANVAVATGEISGIVVLDLDLHKEGCRQACADLAREIGRPPATRTALTGGGGQHLVYEHPGFRIGNGASVFGVGLDIRGDGGYVVAPPSIHISGKSYRWHNPAVPIARWPAVLTERLNGGRERVERPTGPYVPPQFSQGDGTAWGLAGFRRDLEDLATQRQPGRNDALFRITCRIAEMVAGGQLRAEFAYGELERVGLRIGLTPREVRNAMHGARPESEGAIARGEASPRFPTPRTGGRR
jgi:Bifunctional DNA primase/polymerase, N-terminal